VTHVDLSPNDAEVEVRAYLQRPSLGKADHRFRVAVLDTPRTDADLRPADQQIDPGRAST
jgi:hypothetical protein